MSSETIGGTFFATGTAIYRPGEIVSTIEQCSGEVRWNGDVLEQAWKLNRISTVGHVERVDYEWRPVPKA